MELGQQIKQRLKAEGIKVPDLAVLLGIPADRIYKWQKGAKPSDMADYLKVTKWLESVPHGTKENVSRQESDPAMYTTPITTDRRTKIAQPVGENQQMQDLRNEVKWLKDRLSEAESANKELRAMLASSLQKS